MRDFVVFRKSFVSKWLWNELPEYFRGYDRVLRGK